MMHCGGSNLSGTNNITATTFKHIRSDIAVQFNGGLTPLPDGE